MLYGPASLLTGIPIPSTDAIERLRLTAASGSGGDAYTWIHLIAWTAGCTIVLPRCAAALWASLRLMATISGNSLCRPAFSRMPVPCSLLKDRNLEMET